MFHLICWPVCVLLFWTLPDLMPKPNSNGSCKTYTVVSGDYCSKIAAANSLTNAKFETLNANTWGWTGCDNLGLGIKMCLSSGTPPLPAAVKDTVCGPQVPGTLPPAAGVKLVDINPCPLNACCDIWGQCSTTDEFCTLRSQSRHPAHLALLHQERLAVSPTAERKLSRATPHRHSNQSLTSKHSTFSVAALTWTSLRSTQQNIPTFILLLLVFREALMLIWAQNNNDTSSVDSKP